MFISKTVVAVNPKFCKVYDGKLQKLCGIYQQNNLIARASSQVVIIVILI